MKSWFVGFLALFLFSGSSLAEELEDLVRQVKMVGPKAKHADVAEQAWAQLSQRPASDLPQLLAAIDDENPLAANYLRTAIDTIAERTLAEGGELPSAKLEQFVSDTEANPRARRMAFEWLQQVDSKAAQQFLPKMLSDPSVELRRDAVAHKLQQAAKTSDDETRIAHYRQAYDAAVDDDQVKQAVAALKELGESVDVARHYGLLVDWHLVGPFDNKDEQGFDVAHGPEGKPVNLMDEFAGSHGVGQVTWQQHTTDDAYGKVDLAEVIGKHKGAIVYAVNYFTSDKEQPAQFRLTSKNACKLWLNGKLIHAHEVYHSGGSFDQYISSGNLKQGRNEILLKVCQNEQDQGWAQVWEFQLRVCQPVGAAILSADRQNVGD